MKKKIAKWLLKMLGYDYMLEVPPLKLIHSQINFIDVHSAVIADRWHPRLKEELVYRMEDFLVKYVTVECRKISDRSTEYRGTLLIGVADGHR